ncbi:MAG: hypothetical protein WCY27_01625 [archaeon]|jgi:hypothetical protein|nr:hypothetical protein [archaeon]MDD2477473.1 hypothetical protein [Candidatus ainarchaeum sp.]MDD3084756.1 hypothetical protein [Candidatus ainarchaeum sp.]MDD4221005.1 hypothetical protein [Candidatus ainarchaeum sp.]MDD4662423.1 hypothetical protein [Candidatus ainarchaeum sp.]
MFELYFKAWNFFKKKIFFFYMLIIAAIYVLFNIFTQSYITEKIILLQQNVLDMSIINMFKFFINFYGFETILIILVWFASLFIINYLVYIVSLSASKKKESFGKGFSKVLVFTILLFLVIIVFSLIFSLLMSFINIFTIILLIILGLCLIAALFVFTFAAVKLGLNTYTISNALKDSWEFVKRRFILSIVFIIFLMVFIYIIYYLVDFLYSVIFFYNEPASLIIRSILYLVIILYSTNALVLFVEKYSK